MNSLVLVLACVYLQKLSPFGLLYYNAIVALPASLVIASALGEFEGLAEFPYKQDAVSTWGVDNLTVAVPFIRCVITCLDARASADC